MIHDSSGRTLDVAGLGLHAAGAAIVAGLLLAGGSTYLLFDREIASLDVQRQESLDFFARAADVRRQREQLGAQTQLMREQNEALLARAPGAPQESEFLQSLAALAAETQLEIRDYRPGRTIERDGCSALEVQVRTNGNYGSVCRFLAGIADLPRICGVSQFDLGSPAEAGGACAMDVHLELVFAPKLEAVANNPRSIP